MNDVPAEPPAGNAGPASRNFTALLVVSAVLGLSLAIYENVLPLYLDDLKFSPRAMGWIFGVSALCMYLFRVLAGSWSDNAGRKLVYGLTMLAHGGVSILTPFFGGAVAQGALKCVREPAVRTRETMHSLMLYEESQRRFTHFFGLSRGIEFFFQFIGLLAAAYGLKLLTERGLAAPKAPLFLVAGALAVVATIALFLAFKERPREQSANGGVKLRELLHPKLNRALWTLTAAEFIFSIGLSCSHSFAMQLFFVKKFAGVSAATVLLIMALHRLSIALPMFFVAPLIKDRLKRTYVLFIFLEGILIAAPGFIGSLLPAAGIWLLHDLFGAGVWLPAQHTLLQKHSDPANRGKQVSIVLALGSLGTVIGYFLAGALSGMTSVSPATAAGLPFIVGGALVAITSAIIALL